MKRHPKTHPPGPGELFAAPEHPADAHVAEIDGASRGNPGPAAYGVIIRRPDGKVVFKIGKYLGQVTNNVAEYYALITALDYALAHRIAKLAVRSDSELLVRQMQGLYKVKSASLRPLHQRARKLATSLSFFSIEHVPREANRGADRLANVVLDRAEPGGRSRTGEEGGALVDESRSRQSETIPKLRDEARRIRARYEKGVLRPAEPLDLAEGAEVELTIHPRRRN